MLTIFQFDTRFDGKNFKDTTHSAFPQPEYECVGYGDNQGNPYLIGLNNKFQLKTVLLKNVEFIRPT